VHRPLEKVRQAVDEREEMVQRHDAKAQKDRERRCRHRLMEEGSENEDEEDSDELEEDDLEDEEGTHVGHPIILLGATLTKYHVQFSSHPVPTRLSEVPRQRPLTYSKSKVPKVVGGNIPDPSYEVSTMEYCSQKVFSSGQGNFFGSDGEDAGPTVHEPLSERQTVQHKKNRCVEHTSSEGTVTNTTNQ